MVHLALRHSTSLALPGSVGTAAPAESQPDNSHSGGRASTEYTAMPARGIPGFYTPSCSARLTGLLWRAGITLASRLEFEQNIAREAASDAKLAENSVYRPAIDRLAVEPEALRLGRSIFANTCARARPSGTGTICSPNLPTTLALGGLSPTASCKAARMAARADPEWGQVCPHGGEHAIDTRAYGGLGTPGQSLAERLPGRAEARNCMQALRGVHGIDGNFKTRNGPPT